MNKHIVLFFIIFLIFYVYMALETPAKKPCDSEYQKYRAHQKYHDYHDYDNYRKYNDYDDYRKYQEYDDYNDYNNYKKSQQYTDPQIKINYDLLDTNPKLKQDLAADDDYYRQQHAILRKYL
jgi:hypothetical protein